MQIYTAFSLCIKTDYKIWCSVKYSSIKTGNNYCACHQSVDLIYFVDNWNVEFPYCIYICLHFCSGIHCKILDKTVYPGGRKFLDMDNPMRQDTTFPSGSVENGIIIKRTVEEEKVNARYLDHHHQAAHSRVWFYIRLNFINNYHQLVFFS